jgi:ankyrin repeat protein
MPFPGPFSWDPLPTALGHESPGMDEESRRPPLITAALKGDAAVLAELLAAGADVNSACSQYGDTALTFAALFGYLEVVRMLLKQPGVNMNQADHRGATPLMYAVANDHTDVVACLLDAGAQVNLADKSDGDTALIQAARSGRLETFQMLLKHPGVGMDSADLCGETALFHAARRKNPAFVASLLDTGADMTVVNRAGDTALHVAIGKARAATIEIFLLHGAQLEDIDCCPPAPARSAAPSRTCAQNVPCLVGTHRTDR